MKSLVITIFLLLSPTALARNIYFATYVPMSLQNLGYSSAANWVGDCANCHRTTAGGQPGVPDLNAGFGRDFYASVANMGTDFTQAQIQMMIQSIENLDSDADGATNLAEYRARTNPANPLSKPAVAGDGGRTDDPNDFFPGGDLSKTSVKVVSSEDTYGLSGCSAQEQVGANDQEQIARAEIGQFDIPFVARSSIAGLWFLPFLIVLFERRRG